MRADGVIWGVDAYGLLIWIPLTAGGFAAACGVGRAVRSAIVAATLAAAVAWGVAVGASVPPAGWGAPLGGWPAAGWGLVAGAIAMVAAALGPSRYATTWWVVLGTGAAIASQKQCPVGIVGLLHHVALVDLAGGVAAITLLGAVGWEWRGGRSSLMGLSLAGRSSEGVVSGGGEASAEDAVQSVGPERIARRAGATAALLALAIAMAIYREEGLFGLPMMLGLWLGGSEVLAAGVAWQAVAGLVASPAGTAVGKRWRRRLGLVVAGVFATVALVLMPVVIAAATTG